MSRAVRVLVACERSGVVREAFRRHGYDAWSNDLVPAEDGSPYHIQADALTVLDQGWDLMIAHPPCTYLSYAGVSSWNNEGRCKKRLEALDFFRRLWEAPIPHVCIENPKGCASPTIAKYSQEIQPHFFGDPQKKTTWLWLKDLPKLIHFPNATLFNQCCTHVTPEVKIQYRKPGKHYLGGEKKRRYVTDFSGSHTGHKRSITFHGIAEAMADQWGNYVAALAGKRE